MSPVRPGAGRDEPALALANSESTGNGQQQGIQSIEVGARVLLALETGRGPLALSEVARRSEMHPAKVHRYLVSLVRVGLASQDSSSGRYDLGPAARRLGVEALRRTDAESIASAHAARLRDETGHTVDVAVWSDAGPVIVRWDSGAHALPMTVRVGSILPLLDSALGQVFLAHLPDATTSRALAGQQHRHETRALNPAAQTRLLGAVRRHGHASALNNMVYGMSALAAPVFGADGHLALAIGLAVPAWMLAGGDHPELVHALHACAAAASAELGHQPPAGDETAQPRPDDPARPTTHRCAPDVRNSP